MQTEIAARAGVSRERIRQILNLEIPDLDGGMNMRRYPETRVCEACGIAVRRGDLLPQHTGDSAPRQRSCSRKCAEVLPYQRVPS